MPLPPPPLQQQMVLDAAADATGAVGQVVAQVLAPNTATRRGFVRELLRAHRLVLGDAHADCIELLLNSSHLTNEA
jgi:hypothetical protein